MMRKVLVGLCLMLLALISLTGYLVLTEKLTAGEQKIAAGQLQLDQGEQLLAEGKAKLADGKRKLSHIKHVYESVDHIPLLGVMVDKLPVSAVAFAAVKQQIADGDQMVAHGEQRVKNGENQITAGKLALTHGKERLHQMNKIRIACALAAAFFIVLFMLVSLYWYRKRRI